MTEDETAAVQTTLASGNTWTKRDLGAVLSHVAADIVGEASGDAQI